jgi:hypothetical protein
MLETGRDPDLAGEALRTEGGGELGPEDLYRDLTLVLRILGQKDQGHATLAELPFDDISRAQRTLQALAKVEGQMVILDEEVELSPMHAEQLSRRNLKGQDDAE